MRKTCHVMMNCSWSYAMAALCEVHYLEIVTVHLDAKSNGMDPNGSPQSNGPVGLRFQNRAEIQCHASLFLAPKSTILSCHASSTRTNGLHVKIYAECSYRLMVHFLHFSPDPARDIYTRRPMSAA